MANTGLSLQVTRPMSFDFDERVDEVVGADKIRITDVEYVTRAAQ